MNMMDRASMVPPPAPQPRGLRRLCIVSVILLFLSALAIAFIGWIKAIDIYAVSVVPVIMLAAIATATIYWVKRSRLEKAYWTDERYAAHVSAAAVRLRAAQLLDAGQRSLASNGRRR